MAKVSPDTAKEFSVRPLAFMEPEPRNKIIHKPSETNITLEEVLRPIWKVTYYCGILRNWCRPISNPYRLCKIAQLICITLFFSLLASLTVFEVAQLIIQMGIHVGNIHAVISNLIWCTPLFLSLLIYGHCLREQRDFLTFFRDWRALEKEFMHSETHRIMCKSKRIHVVIYATYVLMTIGCLLSIGFDMSAKKDVSHLLSTYQNIRETIPFFWIGLLHLTSIWLVWILSFLGEFVPSFIYYHAALAVSYLENDIREVFAKRYFSNEGKCISLLFKKVKDNDENRLPVSVPQQDLETAIRVMWSRFEDINQLVGRSNFLFGRFMVYSNAWEIFMITSLLYSVLFHLEDAIKMQSTDDFLSYCVNVFLFIFRFISCTLMSSQLYQSVSKLHTFLNYLLSHNWHRMTKEERALLRSFQTRLQSDQLVACPLGLYNITPAYLLTVFGLVVSYVIVLLQSK